MKTSRVLFILIPVLLCSCTKKEPQGCFPNDKLPPEISPLTSFGQRSEWSLDGRTVYFVDKAGGEVWKVDVDTKVCTQLTDASCRPAGHGYYRVLCLSNGDFLLTCGPTRQTTYIQIWDKDMSKPPVSLDVPINEGPAVSRSTMKIAWTEKQEKIYLGEITYENGQPEITGKRMIVDNSNIMAGGVRYEGMLEPQNFRPEDENELIWSLYQGADAGGKIIAEVMGISLVTDSIVNYSKAPDQYDEPEGIWPDGQFTLVECDHHDTRGPGHIDIYKLRLDGTGNDYKRITYFSDEEGFRASNPVVRDDGTAIAFQASLTGSAAGVGCGLYLYKF